jgi:hypothetical protein
MGAIFSAVLYIEPITFHLSKPGIAFLASGCITSHFAFLAAQPHDVIAQSESPWQWVRRIFAWEYTDLLVPTTLACHDSV